MSNRQARFFWTIQFVFALVLWNTAASIAAAHDPGDTSAANEIKGLIAKYAEAVNREPVDLTLAASVWADSPDDSLIFPLGEIRGWDRIRQNFYQGIMEGRLSERTLTPSGIQVHAYGDCAWAEFTWRFVAKSRKDGSKVETNGAETQIYRKLGPHRWGLVHVHYSSLSSAGRSSASSEGQGAFDGLASQDGYPSVWSQFPQLAAQTSSQDTARSQQTSGQHDGNAFISHPETADQRRGQLREFPSGIENDLARGAVTFSFRIDNHRSQRRDLQRPELQSHDLGNLGESQAGADVPPEAGVGAGAVQVAERGGDRMPPERISRALIAEDGAPAARSEYPTHAATSAGNRSGPGDYNYARRAAQSGLQSHSRVGGEDMILRGNVVPQPRQKRTGDLRAVGAGESDASRAHPGLTRTCRSLAHRGKNLAFGRCEPNLHRVGGSRSGSAKDASAFVGDPRCSRGAAAVDAEIRVHEWHHTCTRITEFHTLIDGEACDSI